MRTISLLLAILLSCTFCCGQETIRKALNESFKKEFPKDDLLTCINLNSERNSESDSLSSFENYMNYKGAQIIDDYMYDHIMGELVELTLKYIPEKKHKKIPKKKLKSIIRSIKPRDRQEYLSILEAFGNDITNFLISESINSYQKIYPLDCSSVRNGAYNCNLQSDYHSIERTNTNQKEIVNTQSSSYDIHWDSDCYYVMTNQENHNKAKVRIIEGKHDGFLFYSYQQNWGSVIGTCRSKYSDIQK